MPNALCVVLRGLEIWKDAYVVGFGFWVVPLEVLVAVLCVARRKMAKDEAQWEGEKLPVDALGRVKRRAMSRSVWTAEEYTGYSTVIFWVVLATFTWLDISLQTSWTATPTLHRVLRNGGLVVILVAGTVGAAVKFRKFVRWMNVALARVTGWKWREFGDIDENGIAGWETTVRPVLLLGVVAAGLYVIFFYWWAVSVEVWVRGIGLEGGKGCDGLSVC